MHYNLSKLIHRSHKAVTIMFTDIVDSTRHWDTKGDIKGRLMVDQHNRLVFPVIKRFRGKVIKTIGDAVMASFSSPQAALKAAVGIQQALDNYRSINRNFKLEVRIGIHTGKALVEKDDVFGDVVNVAARVEGQAAANEILVSGSSEKQIKRAENFLSKKKSFIPKGKNTEIALYRCDWRKMESQVEGINYNAILPLLARQRTEILIYLLAITGLLYYVVQNYLRYLLADHENIYLMSFNPQQFLASHPVAAGLLFVVLLILLRVLRYLTVMPVFVFRLIKGGFGYAAAFALALAVMVNLPAAYNYNTQKPLLESHHLFVDVLEDGTGIHENPSFVSPVIHTAQQNELFLQSDVREQDKITWNKVLLGVGQFGWIARILPPAFGVAERRLTVSNKFSFYYRDLYALAFGLIGFVWGFWSFAIRPL